MLKTSFFAIAFFISISILTGACSGDSSTNKTDTTAVKNSGPDTLVPISKPLVSNIYTADPSAHLFDGKIYIYPSHDIDAGIPENDKGDHFAMRDYHILSMDNINDIVTDHGV